MKSTTICTLFQLPLALQMLVKLAKRDETKTEMTEVTEYDDSVTCKHSYSEQCHQSYVTDYKPAQKEECDEEFVKNCHIGYKKIAQQETVRKCHEPLICGGEGPEVCRTAHTTACETKLEVHE